MLLLAVLILVSAPQAWAGHYSLAYSGGTAQSTNPANNKSYQGGSSQGGGYGGGSGGYGGGSGGGSYGSTDGTGWFPGSDANTASCTGQITTTFTWVPSDSGDTAPISAVVIQTSTAAAQVGSSTWATASCDDGLNDGQCSGTKYTVGAGGSSFMVQCSPSATITGGANPSSPSNGSVSVSYTASVSPIINPNGVTRINGVQYLLTGQQVTATLSGIPGGSAQSVYKKP